ncbi:MAG TPA: molybdenum cofactor biosynthesis protein MoaE [Gemmatimonadaceae bacterium]|nr:molybdenum cofactor biosynthesis protein MoaE [Gemmatimonadaceae bacterium]
MKRVSILTGEIDPASLINEVSSPQYGAISLFVGTVREVNEGRSVSAIEYSAYKSMATAELQRILDEAEGRFEVSALVVEHRIGLLGLGDVSIAIVAAHPHRAPALDCTRYVIEEIKKRVPIWKKEHYTDGTREWVDPTRAAQPSGA